MPVDQTALSQGGVQLAHGGQNLTADDLPIRLSELVQEYYWVMLAIPLRPSLLTIKAIDLADVTIQLADIAEKWLTQATARNFMVVRPEPKLIARLARKIARRQVGLALSSGGARGLAHIGVLEVLEREHIPVDLIAATQWVPLSEQCMPRGHPSPKLRVSHSDEAPDEFYFGLSDVGFGICRRARAWFAATARLNI